MARLRPDGNLEETVNVHGFGRRVFIGKTVDEIAKKIENFVAKYGSSKTNRGGYREGSGRPRGVTKDIIQQRQAQAAQARIQVARANAKNVRDRKNAQRVKDQIDSIFNRILLASSAGLSASRAKIKMDIARGLLALAFSTRGNYDIYTGHLDNSYVASLVNGRRITMSITTDGSTPTRQFDKYGRVRIYVRRHPSNRKYRYKKYWERKNGYANTGITAYRDKIVGIGKRYGDSASQSGVILENVAPYAGAVQAQGYLVVPHGIERSFAGRAAAKQKQLVFMMTKKMLHAAKLI